ncbi:UNKNOWN [Stylonychia lemnae]|uniref:Transmembrane protein n=1 Tax=Stylonychia lemnae TaxID=5949 RepID=A0A077ZYY8_STYLE|nr:UNKNOWN [Stylonychia lemnae]|eukprot:CDW74388.1 UNKNOWN [Stylonychia lemnae]
MQEKNIEKNDYTVVLLAMITGLIVIIVCAVIMIAYTIIQNRNLKKQLLVANKTQDINEITIKGQETKNISTMSKSDKHKKGEQLEETQKLNTLEQIEFAVQDFNETSKVTILSGICFVCSVTLAENDDEFAKIAVKRPFDRYFSVHLDCIKDFNSRLEKQEDNSFIFDNEINEKPQIEVEGETLSGRNKDNLLHERQTKRDSDVSKQSAIIPNLHLLPKIHATNAEKIQQTKNQENQPRRHRFFGHLQPNQNQEQSRSIQRQANPRGPSNLSTRNMLNFKLKA